MRIAVAAAVLFTALVIPAWAYQTADVQPDEARISVQSHIIRSGADADSYSVLAELGLTQKAGVGIERIRISDADGSLTLGSFYLKRELWRSRCKNPSVIAAYGGLRFLHGDSTQLDDIESDGLLIGLSGQTRLVEGLNAYASAGVSFLDDTLIEAEFTLGYAPIRNLEISAGYKSYTINGDTFGGMTLGVSGRF